MQGGQYKVSDMQKTIMDYHISAILLSLLKLSQYSVIRDFSASKDEANIIFFIIVYIVSSLFCKRKLM